MPACVQATLITPYLLPCAPSAKWYVVFPWGISYETRTTFSCQATLMLRMKYKQNASVTLPVALRMQLDLILMTGPKGNRVLFPKGAVSKCFVIPPSSKLEKEIAWLWRLRWLCPQYERQAKGRAVLLKRHDKVFFFAVNKNWRQNSSCFGFFWCLTQEFLI